MCCAGAGSLGSQAPSPTVDGGPSATSGRSGARRGRGPGVGEKRKSKKDDLRSKNREAQRRFREKQKCALFLPALPGSPFALKEKSPFFMGAKKKNSSLFFMCAVDLHPLPFQNENGCRGKPRVSCSAGKVRQSAVAP